MRLLPFLCLLLLGCTETRRLISYQVRTRPVYNLDPKPQKIIILNANDIKAKHYRDSKEELFINLTEDIMQDASEKIKRETNAETEIIKGFTSLEKNGDSLLQTLLDSHLASHAIVINFFDTYFNQTRVEVTKSYSGSKNREAFYDIVSHIGYAFYNKSGLIKNMALDKRKFHSSRSVLSGILAAGPNIVVKREDAHEIVNENLQEFLNYFFPGEAKRSRILFIGKGFESIKSALDKWDYETVLNESLKYTSDSNKEKAARASDNCAVLFEKNNQQDLSLDYLRRSINLYPLFEAKNMLTDFE